jgi:dihydropteroate synthase
MRQAPAIWAGLSLDRPRVMGILNATPDSFSDGGAYDSVDAAVSAGMAMAEDGADIVDVGGESTRPDAPAVPAEVEQQRVVSVIRALARRGLRVSVDSRNACTMAAALDAGATIVNDVSGLAYDLNAAPLVARRGCPVVLMHMRGDPATMRDRAVYTDLVAEVTAELQNRLTAALAAGIRRDAIVLDPGVGFAKNADQSVGILHALPRLAALGCPLLVGVSRKSFIGAVAQEKDARARLPGSIAAGLFALSQGAAILRVHDVRETVQAIRVWTALAGEAGQDA